MSGKQPQPIGDEGCHSVIRDILAARRSCRILDVPCGHGVLSSFLHQRGWEVVAADIDSGNMLCDDVPFHEVNLNRPLPFADASFDAILCANGLHRLFNPGGAIAEFARILRPGGALYINLNNYSSLDKRVRFLLMGSINTMVNLGTCEQTIDDPEAHVRIPLLYAQIAGMLARANLEVVETRACISRTRDRLLLPLSWMIRFVARLLPKRRTAGNFVEEVNSAALMPGGSYMFIEALKPRRGEF